MSDSDHYAVLGVSPDADTAAIRAAYRKRARTAHPDVGGSAEEFHLIQRAWEVLGDEQSRAAYDASRSGGGQSAESSAGFTNGSGPNSPGATNGPTSSNAGGGVYAQRSWTASRSGSAERRSGPHRTRSTAADQPPVYEPSLSTPEPLSLTLTSQKVHGDVAAGGFFGGGKSQRRQQRTVQLLDKHLLEQLAAARLFNDVYLSPVETDRKGRRRPPRGAERAEHVVLCGHTLVVIASAEVPSAAAAWDGRVLRAAGRQVNLPDLSAQGRRLRGLLGQLLPETLTAQLQIETQLILNSSAGDLFQPVVEAQGAGRQGAQPLAAGRAMGHIANVLSAGSEANLVDRHMMAALRDQLATP